MKEYNICFFPMSNSYRNMKIKAKTFKDAAERALKANENCPTGILVKRNNYQLGVNVVNGAITPMTQMGLVNFKPLMAGKKTSGTYRSEQVVVQALRHEDKESYLMIENKLHTPYRGKERKVDSYFYISDRTVPRDVCIIAFYTPSEEELGMKGGVFKNYSNEEFKHTVILNSADTASLFATINDPIMSGKWSFFAEPPNIDNVVHDVMSYEIIFRFELEIDAIMFRLRANPNF